MHKGKGQIRASASGAAGFSIPAESHMSVVCRAGQREGRVTQIQLEPRTGRSHQLRVQCSKRSLPIVGDQTYGNFSRNRSFAQQNESVSKKRMFLHCLETSFRYDFKGGRFQFVARAPLPDDFLGLVDQTSA